MGGKGTSVEYGDNLVERMRGVGADGHGAEGSGLIAPHGGKLIDRELRGEEAEEARNRAAAYPAVRLTGQAWADARCIATGVYSPLGGFMTRRDYWRVVDEMRLASGLVWSMPVVLPVDAEEAGHGREIGRAACRASGKSKESGGSSRKEKVRR